MKLSELSPVFSVATKQKCEEIVSHLLQRGDKDRSHQARAMLLKDRFYIHRGDLWIDGDVMVDVDLIVEGDFIVDGDYDDSESMLIVIGSLMCRNMISNYGIFVRDDLICGGVSYHYYNDWAVEVLGTLAARVHITDDKCVTAGTWLTEARGDIGDNAEAACRLLGFRDGRADLDGDGANEARRVIREAKEERLTYLDLEGLQLTELPDELFELDWIEGLNLSNNEIVAIPESIGNFSQLLELDISGNRVRRIPKSIGKLTSLENLDMSRNRLCSLPDEIVQLDNLFYLDVCKNEIVHLCDNIGDLQNIERIDLSYNRIVQLPASLSRFNDTWSLNIRNNPLCEIPEYLSVSDEVRSNIEETVKKFHEADSASLDDTCEELPIFPAKYTFDEMLKERRQQGKNVFVIPLPSMAELIERWGEDWAWRKRLWYPDRDAELSDDERKFLAAKGEEWLLALIVSRNLPSGSFADHITHENRRIRWALAAARACPPDCLRVLAKDDDAIVRAAVAGNINCPPELRADLMDDGDWRVRVGTIFGPHDQPYQAPDSAALERLVNDADVNVRRVVAAIPSLPDAFVAKLFDDPEGEVRSRLSRFQTLGASIWERLAGDADARTRLSVAHHVNYCNAPFNVSENSEVRNRILQKLMLDPDAQVREKAANRWQPFPFYEANVEAMARDTVDDVRQIVAGITRNPNVLAKLMDDVNGDVAENAILNPNTTQQALNQRCLRIVNALLGAEVTKSEQFSAIEMIKHFGDQEYFQKYRIQKEKDERLECELGLVRVLLSKYNISEECVEAIAKLEQKYDKKLFDSPMHLSPPKMVDLWTAELDRHCCGDHCDCHKEKRALLQRLKQCSYDESMRDEFFRILFRDADQEKKSIALANKYCPGSYILDAVSSYVDDHDDHDLKYTISSIAANPVLPPEARAMLVQHVKQHQDERVVSGLKQNPAVAVEEWLDMATACKNTDVALALWLWHGRVLNS